MVNLKNDGDVMTAERSSTSASSKGGSNISSLLSSVNSVLARKGTPNEGANDDDVLELTEEVSDEDEMFEQNWDAYEAPVSKELTPEIAPSDVVVPPQNTANASATVALKEQEVGVVDNVVQNATQSAQNVIQTTTDSAQQANQSGNNKNEVSNMTKEEAKPAAQANAAPQAQSAAPATPPPPVQEQNAAVNTATIAVTTAATTANAAPVATNTSASVAIAVDSKLLSETTAAVAASAFKELREKASPKMLSDGLKFASGSSLESLVVELMRPYLSEWLNQHLPAIVKSVVEKEVRRIMPQED